MVGQRFHHYEIESELGHGGMGVVYLARDTKLERRVAIKVLAADLTSDDVARERFIREAKAAASVEHDSICAIFEIGETDGGQTFIVMPHYEGKTLKELIEEGPIDIGRALDLTMQIGSGLAAAHAKGIVHRDIKPANVLVTKRGKVKILDFGLAKLSGQLDLTKTRSSVGTIPYMSPEQIRGDTIDERTDIWSVGAVLYEMLSGRRPFTGEYEQAVSYSILNVDQEPLSNLREDLPTGVADVVARCLAKQPTDRYQTVADMLRDVEVPSGVRPFTGSYTREIPKPSRKTWATGVLGGLVLAVVVWLFYTLVSERSVAGDSLERGVAILPFKVPAGSEDGKALAFGLQEWLTTGISRLQNAGNAFWVVPSSDVDATMSVSDVHRVLGAGLAVTGSIQFQGSQVRITMTLNNAVESKIIKSDQFDDSGSGDFAIQDKAVLRLSRMLQTGAAPSEVEQVAQGASNVRSANSAYLRAVGYLKNAQTVEELDVVIGLLKSATDEDTGFAAAFAALGSAYWTRYERSKDPRLAELAIENSNRALELNEKLPGVHLALAKIQEGLSDYDAALKEYDEALAIDSTNAEAYRLKGTTLRRLGRNDEALTSLMKSARLAPDYWRSYYSLALYMLYARGDYDEAFRYIDKGREHAPDGVWLWNLEAVMLWNQGRVGEAMARFDKIREINPEYQSAWNNTATALFYSGRFDEAVEMYRKVAEQLRPYSADAQGNLADAYAWSTGQRDHAPETYEKALELSREQLRVSPQDAEVQSGMAYYFARLGQMDSARVYLSSAIAGYPAGAVPADEAFGIGEVYVALGDESVGKQWLEQGLSQNVGSMQLQFSPWLKAVREDVDFMNRISVYRK